MTKGRAVGTGFTMEDGFYHRRMGQHGIEVLVPDDADRAEVHRVIYEELCLGVVSTQSHQRYLEVAGGLAKAGAEGLVLGCTEIELLVKPGETDLHQFPTTAIHVDAILDAAQK